VEVEKHLKLSWALYAAILIPGAVVVNMVVKELLKEWEQRSQPQLNIPNESNWQVRKTGNTLTYEIKMEADRGDVSAARLRVFPDVRKGFALKDICVNGAMLEILRRGTVLEFEYVDRRGAQLGSFVVRPGDCT
jgi:hypothetical protein